MDTNSRCNQDASLRTLTDINTILELAKLDLSSVKKDVQCLSYSSNFGNEDIKLIELEQPVLDALLAGGRFEIRGDVNESAVAVVNNCTYDLKEAETSNSLLLLPNMLFGCDIDAEGDQQLLQKEVCSIEHTFYELRPMKPKLKKVKILLQEKPYKGKEWENDEENDGKMYTWDELCELIQASDLQIKERLVQIGAFEFEGFWRLLDFEYLTTVVHHIIHLCEERDWLAEGIDKEECLDVLKELFPVQIISHIIDIFSENTSVNDGMDIETRKAFLDEDKVCKHFAELCLRVSGKFNLDEFLKTWQESVPGEMKTSMSQLEGIALIDRESHPGVIWFYSVDDLPEDMTQRFEALFEEKKKWSMEEITPYISDLTTEKMDVVALLTKFSRSSTQNGIKVFSSRKTTS